MVEGGLIIHIINSELWFARLLHQNKLKQTIGRSSLNMLPAAVLTFIYLVYFYEPRQGKTKELHREFTKGALNGVPVYQLQKVSALMSIPRGPRRNGRGPQHLP